MEAIKVATLASDIVSAINIFICITFTIIAMVRRGYVKPGHRKVVDIFYAVIGIYWAVFYAINIIGAPKVLWSFHGLAAQIGVTLTIATICIDLIFRHKARER